jgi:hypothetical protein
MIFLLIGTPRSLSPSFISATNKKRLRVLGSAGSGNYYSEFYVLTSYGTFEPGDPRGPTL